MHQLFSEIGIENLKTKTIDAYNNNLPFTIFKKPFESQLNAYFQEDDTIHTLQSFNDVGFVFAPFKKQNDVILFPVDKCKTFRTSKFKIEEFTNYKEHFTESLADDLKDTHIKLLDKTINFLKNGNALKIVVARKESLVISDFDFFKTFQRIVNKYNSAYCYVWFHPSKGMWMGATPERLLVAKNNVIETMALAGTQQNTNQTKVIWGEKEKNEQQIVTDYIEQQLRKVSQNVSIGIPETEVAGNLLHIKTTLKVTIKSSYQLGEIISLLHPTPAICGIPLDTSYAFITHNEDFEREYYAGYLGELNVNTKTYLNVNLRCIKIENKTVNIYVGGGITSDSISDNEWKETVAKAEVMKKIL